MTNKKKVMLKARGAISRTTVHLGLYGMKPGVESANAILYEIVDWAFDEGAGEDRPCPVNEGTIKSRIKW